MRKAHADYAALDAALQAHQRQTLCDYASARGTSDWRDEPLCCAAAVVLAVDNVLADLRTTNVPERQALLRAAMMFDLDFETLCRQRRRRGRRRG